MHYLMQFLTDTAVLHREHKAVVTTVWLFSCLAALITFPHRFVDIPAFIVIAVLVAAFAFYMLIWYEKTLVSRMASVDGGPVWQVQINGVTVSEMKDADYAAIRRAVLFEGRLYGAQLVNLMGVAMRVVDGLLMVIPICVFWLAIGCFFFAPDFFAQALVAIQKITPDQTAKFIPILAAKIIPTLLVLMLFLVLAVHLVTGRRFGFVSQFDQACGFRIRRTIACAADGEVSLYRIENGDFITPDELAATSFPKH